MRRPSIIAILALSVACATVPSPSPCGAGLRAEVQDTLYFGTDIPQGQGHVTAEQWQNFLAAVITPRFPDGLTSWETAGQWRGRDGVIVKEKGYVLQVTHPLTSESDKAIREVMDAYANDFQQEAVLRVRTSVCVSF